MRFVCVCMSEYVCVVCKMCVCVAYRADCVLVEGLLEGLEPVGCEVRRQLSEVARRHF